MSGWVLTAGLQNLRNQVNAAFPDRDHASDGTIGNAAHQAETSGHNPDDTAGSRPAWNGDPDTLPEVRSWDMDSDLRAVPATAQQVVDHIRRLPGLGSVLRYMIYNHRMYHVRDGFASSAYNGSSGHTEHIHFEGAWSQAADNNTGFNYRLEEIPVALTPADKAWFISAIDARCDAIEASMLQKIPGAVGSLPVNVNPGGDKPSMQPWSRVDAYGSPERRKILDAVLALDAKLTSPPAQ